MVKGGEVNSPHGRVWYAPKVLQKIIERAILSHEGIESLEKSYEESIRVETRKGFISVNLFLILNLDKRVPETGWEVQKSLKETIEKTTGLRVEQINIYVQGFDSRKEKQLSAVNIPV